jgi:hypothetical protein
MSSPCQRNGKPLLPAKASLANTSAKLSWNIMILAATEADETKIKENCCLMEMRATGQHVTLKFPK